VLEKEPDFEFRDGRNRVKENLDSGSELRVEKNGTWEII
jgi:hypothetical protein